VGTALLYLALLRTVSVLLDTLVVGLISGDKGGAGLRPGGEWRRVEEEGKALRHFGGGVY
jgi:hypothetical protein